ncbi:MAG: glycosyltransferase family 2 protein, partial [Candidatus Omnitrophota bacterium]
VRIAHANSWYARFEKIGTNFAQRFNFVSFQAIFGRTISFGHHHLARANLISKIRLPKGLLSHDNWDTVLLDQMGYRVAFCADVHVYDEAPSNYLEARARGRRWAQGTLQGIPLIFMPRISLGSRFLVFFGIYLYVADVVFFLWLILGLLAHSCLAGELIHFEIDSIWLGACTNSKLKWALLFSVAVVYLHKLVLLKNPKDFKDFLYELVVSTALTLNNVFYTPLDIVSIPLRKLHWKPMAKNPFARVDWRNTVKTLWPGTVAGLFGLYFCLFLTPYFVWPATPLLTSLILSIPVAYWTAASVPERFKAWI